MLSNNSLASRVRRPRDSLKAAEDKVYFVTNSRYLILPVALSIVVVLAYLLLLGKPQVVGGVFVSLWLTFWTLGVAGLFRKVIQAWRSAWHSQKGEIVSVGGALFFTAFARPFLFGEIMGFIFLVTFTSISLAIFLLAAAALHILFIYLLKAPTIAGRLVIDRVQGFKMFLGKVAGHRRNRTAPPQETPEVFEKYLPYAVALDVERIGQNSFQGFSALREALRQSSRVCAVLLFRLFLERIRRHKLRIVVQRLVHRRDCCLCGAPGSSSGSGGGGGGSGGGGGGWGGGGW